MKTKEQVLNWVDYMLKSNPCMNVEDKNMFNAIKYYITEKQTETAKEIIDDMSAERIYSAQYHTCYCSNCRHLSYESHKSIFCPYCGEKISEVE